MADSIIKDIYNDIKTVLATITDIPSGNVAVFKDQISTSLPSFPYVLIDFPYIYYKDASARVQLGNAMVRVIVCQSISSIPDEDDPTAVFELKDKIYAALQGTRRVVDPDDENDQVKYGPLTRGSERTEFKYTGVYVFEMDFYTTIQDDGVYVLKNYTAMMDVELEMPKGDIRGAVPADQGRIGLKIDNLGTDHDNEIRTGKTV